MNEAIRLAAELVNENKVVSLEEKAEHMDRLKPAINNLLHEFLPEDITLKEADILAMVINEIVWNPRRFLDAKNQDFFELIKGIEEQVGGKVVHVGHQHDYTEGGVSETARLELTEKYISLHCGNYSDKEKTIARNAVHVGWEICIGAIKNSS